jgi:hypothetical protein
MDGPAEEQQTMSEASERDNEIMQVALAEARVAMAAGEGRGGDQGRPDHCHRTQLAD